MLMPLPVTVTRKSARPRWLDDPEWRPDGAVPELHRIVDQIQWGAASMTSTEISVDARRHIEFRDGCRLSATDATVISTSDSSALTFDMQRRLAGLIFDRSRMSLMRLRRCLPAV